MAQPALQNTPLPESALIDYLGRAGRSPAGRLAAHVKLSNLSRANSRAHYIDLAADIFSDALRGREGRLFRLYNNDLMFVATGVSLATINVAVDRLRALFSDDPAIAYAKAAPLCDWYRVEQDYDRLMNMAQDWLDDAEIAQADYVRHDPAAGLAPIKPELLGRVERALVSVDFTNLVRRQAICTIVGDHPPQPLFDEVYVSILELQDLVTPGVNWLADPWLFQYITQILDQRVMAMLSRKGAPVAAPFSINLNLASVLTPEFRRFDEIVSPQVKGRTVIEFNKLDVFADMGAFLFARDYLHARGYRLCLDGLSHLTLPYYNRAKLGFDLMKLYWRPEGLEELLPEMIPEARQAIIEAGQARVILCHCDAPAAVETGQQLGIVMYQGRYVDRLAGAVKTGA